jgi:hypothetical protein
MEEMKTISDAFMNIVVLRKRLKEYYILLHIKLPLGVV